MRVLSNWKGLAVVLGGAICLWLGTSARGYSAPPPEPATGIYDPVRFGLSASSPDNTSALQAAIDACQKGGGGVVQLPAGHFRIAGTLRMTANHVWLRGQGRAATTLDFDNGAADCVVVGTPIPPKPAPPTSQTRCNRLSDLNMVFGKKAAGRTVAVLNHFDFLLEKVTIDHCVIGVFADRVNNVVLRDVIIIPDNPGAANRADVPWSSWVGVWWDTPPDPKDPGARSDVLYFDNVSINCNAAPGTGVLWDGMTNTFLVCYANILNGAYGLRVINSRHDTHYLVPAFLNAFALLIENSTTGLSIETGTEFKITSSDMDMCRENTVQILPDLAGSPTDCVLIANSRIGNTQKTGVFADARDVKISGVQMFSTSLAGRGKYPAIEVGPHARDVSITDVRADEHIGGRLPSYGVSIAAGATNVQIDNLNASDATIAAVQDRGARGLTIGKVIEPGGAGPAGLFAEGPTSGVFAARHAGATRFLSRNAATGRASASIGAATGSDQAELEIVMNDNGGKPFAAYRYGGKVSAAVESVAERVITDASGNERLRIGAEGLKSSVPFVDAATVFVTPKPGGSVPVPPATSRLVLTPAGPVDALAVGTPSSPVNGQLYHVSSVAHPVSGVRWPGDVIGAPAAIPAAHTVILQYRAGTRQWLCVQG